MIRNACSDDAYCGCIKSEHDEHIMHVVYGDTAV